MHKFKYIVICVYKQKEELKIIYLLNQYINNLTCINCNDNLIFISWKFYVVIINYIKFSINGY